MRTGEDHTEMAGKTGTEQGTDQQQGQDDTTSTTTTDETGADTGTQTDAVLGLLDDDDTISETTDDGGTDDGGQIDADTITQAVTAALQSVDIAGMVSRTVDQRIGATLAEVRQQAAPTGQPAAAGQQAAPADDADMRAARVVFSAAMSQVRYQSPAERDMARQLGAALIAETIGTGAMPDEVGTQAADKAARMIRDYRKALRESIVKQLRDKGVIPKAETGQGATVPITPASDFGSAFQQGQARAQSKYGATK